jgi:hypothetical protein
MGKRKYSDGDLAQIELRVEAALIDAYERATPDQRDAGKGWYFVANEEAKLLASSYNVARGAEETSAVIAVLSPMTRWAQNLDDAWALYTGDEPRHALPENVRKARRIIAGEDIATVLGGRKVNSFRMNIWKPRSILYATHDTWMARIYELTTNDVFSTFGVYDACTRGAQRAADTLGLLASQVQAIAWITHKAEEDRQQKEMDRRYGHTDVEVY